MDAIFLYAVRNKPSIVLVFKIFYWFLFFFVLFGAYTMSQNQPQYMNLYELGKDAGTASVIFFLITITPGMLRRFGINHKLINLLITFRRYLGISTFMLAFVHYMIVKFIPTIGFNLPPVLATFEGYGLGALALLIPLFLTSNDFSVRVMKAWWKRLHRAVYIIAWLMFFHVMLQGNWLGWVIGAFAVAEVASLLYSWFKVKTSPTVPTTPSP